MTDLVAKNQAILVEEVKRLVVERGDPSNFDVESWVAHWLSQRIPALGDQSPMELLKSEQGCKQLIRLLHQSADGVYA